MPGTQLLSLAEGGKVLSAQTAGFDSVVGSSKIADDFNVTNAVYKEAQNIPSYIDASLTLEVLKKKK
jgi:NitT/TauT family transport system substrate-binding protein